MNRFSDHRLVLPPGLTPRQAVALQRTLAARVRLEPFRGRPRVVAGADVSAAWRGTRLWGAVVVLETGTWRVLDEQVASLPARFPYVPGLLSFREVPVLLAAGKKLRVRPDVVLVDGQGLAHPRRLGLACHLGLAWDVPTIGCAKSRLVGDPRSALGDRRGSRRALYDHGEKVGVLLRTRDGVKPLWISPGHRMDIDSAAQLALACGGRCRLPEPVRRAHAAAGAARRAGTGQ